MLCALNSIEPRWNSWNKNEIKFIIFNFDKNSYREFIIQQFQILLFERNKRKVCFVVQRDVSFNFSNFILVRINFSSWFSSRWLWFFFVVVVICHLLILDLCVSLMIFFRLKLNDFLALWKKSLRWAILIDFPFLRWCNITSIFDSVTNKRKRSRKSEWKKCRSMYSSIVPLKKLNLIFKLQQKKTKKKLEKCRLNKINKFCVNKYIFPLICRYFAENWIDNC